MKCCYNKFSMRLLLGKRRRHRRNDNRMVKLEFPFSFQNCLLGAYIIIIKISGFKFGCMVSPPGAHLVYTWWGAQRLCRIDSERNHTMEVGPWSRTVEKRPSSMSDFVVHVVNQPKLLHLMTTTTLNNLVCSVILWSFMSLWSFSRI